MTYTREGRGGPAGAFTGREAELARLLGHWEAVKAGSGPRVAVLLAEPGLGKTRMAQELYARLVAREQGEGTGYWPPALGEDGDNLRVNPPVEECDGSAATPFLWWGVRLSDPEGRNQVVSGALPGHVEAYLVPHLEPFQREQRRRGRLARLARLGGTVAADVVADLVPLLGLLKKVGEVGMEVKGLADEWRRDAEVVDSATAAGARRASLAEQVVGDLRTLLSGSAGVPAVLLLDDLQFSYADPGVTALVEGLVAPLRAEAWPLLVVVTHWEREWLAAAGDDTEGPPPSPAAAVLQALAHAAPAVVDVMRLGPVGDLAPVVSRSLPGLTAAQRGALLDRAGGNPRLLEELVRFALTPRGRALFVGLDPTGPLSEAGVEQLLNRGSSLAELVARRLEEAPEAVQRALALAALQGQEFEAWLVAALAEELGADAPDGTARALRAAADPHAMTAWLGGARAAFAQRVYREVALEALPGWFDEGVATRAMRSVVKGCLRGERAAADDPASVRGLMQVAAALFEDDPDGPRYAAVALHWLVSEARSAGDVHAAAALARRLATVLERLGDDQDGELLWLRTAQLALGEVGEVEARRPLLAQLVSLAGRAYDDDVNEWSVPLYVNALLDVAAYYDDVGDAPRASEALHEAVRVVAEADGLLPADDVDVLTASLDVHDRLADHLAARGEEADAAALREHVVTLAGRLAELDPAPGRAARAALGRVDLARSRASQGRLDEAAELVDLALPALRAFAASAGSIDAERSLSLALDVAAGVARQRGDGEGALRHLEESLAIVRRHQVAAPGAPWVEEAVAETLALVAEQRARTGDLAGAWAAVGESVGLRRGLAVGGGSGPKLRLGASLSLAAAVAAQREDMDVAHALSREALAELRALGGGPGDGASLAVATALTRALLVAVLPVLRREGVAAASALLTEARGLLSAVPERSRGGAELTGLAAGLERLEAYVRSEAGGAGPADGG